MHHELLKLNESYFPDRLLRIGTTLSGLIDDYKITDVAYERPCVSGNVGANLNMVVGIVQYIAALHELHVSAYTPASVKKVLTTKGKANKDEVEGGVRTLLNLSDDVIFRTDHESDAVAVALTHLSKLSAPKKVTNNAI